MLHAITAMSWIKYTAAWNVKWLYPVVYVAYDTASQKYFYLPDNYELVVSACDNAVLTKILYNLKDHYGLDTVMKTRAPHLDLVRM